MIDRIAKAVLCFFGAHDWIISKSVVAKECDDLYLKTTLFKCATCSAVLTKIEQYEPEGNEMLRTCASCKHKKEMPMPGHRVTVRAFCWFDPIECIKNKSCERYEARFEKSSVNRVVVKMEDYLL